LSLPRDVREGPHPGPRYELPNRGACGKGKKWLKRKTRKNDMPNQQQTRRQQLGGPNERVKKKKEQVKKKVGQQKKIRNRHRRERGGEERERNVNGMKLFTTKNRKKTTVHARTASKPKVQSRDQKPSGGGRRHRGGGREWSGEGKNTVAQKGSQRYWGFAGKLG